MSTTHQHDLSAAAHTHAFGDAGSRRRADALRTVAVLTLATMVLELGVGTWSGSLALLADGWHMGTHAAALGGAALAAHWSARVQRNSDFAFGGWKIEVLTAYTSALLLLAVALWLVVDAALTLHTPQPIAYREALVVAVFGLLVNVASAWLLARGAKAGLAEAIDEHAHTHAPSPAAAHAQAHGHGHAHAHDHNFHAAYLHVLADALTSVLAIGALVGGGWFGLRWLDPVAALVGAAVIARWSLAMLRASARALVDASAEPSLRERVRAAIEIDNDAKVADLHVWQVGPQAWSAALSVVADRPLAAADYHLRLTKLLALKHITIEVHACSGPRAR